MVNLVNRTIKSDSEIEESFKKSAPEILYKFRSFQSSFTKQSFKDSSLYFANPKDLNDDYDIRLPIEIDYEEVEKPEFVERLITITKRVYPNLNPSSFEFIGKVIDKFREIKEDPKTYYENTIKLVRQGKIYDEFGVLSLTEDCLNEKMWGYYGDSNKGFCIGYDTFNLFKYGAGSFGKVIYSDEALKFSLIGPLAEDFSIRSSFQKATKWEHESEYRFVNYMEFLKTREKKFSYSIVKEVIMGSQISKENYDFIVQVLIDRYNHLPKLFKIEKSLCSYDSKKSEIIY